MLYWQYTENAVHHFPCFISINSNHESLTGGIPTCVQRYNINISEWRHLQYAWMFHELDSGGISALLPSLAFPPFPGCSDHLMGTEPKNWKYDIKKKKYKPYCYCFICPNRHNRRTKINKRRPCCRAITAGILLRAPR